MSGMDPTDLDPALETTLDGAPEDLPGADDEHAQQQQLDRLGAQFSAALRDKDAGKVDQAEDAFREILRVEPRLPEPRMELARVLLDTDRMEEAEEHAREALTHLDAAGPWTEEIPENIIRGLAHALLAEILRRRADDDDVIFGDPIAFHDIVREAQHHFQKAHEYDPADEYASYHAFFLGVRGHAGAATVVFDDGLGDSEDADPTEPVSGDN